jgi:hypothetical protein
MADMTFSRRRISFVMANASALLVLAGIGADLARYWNNTSWFFHFWGLFMVGSFVLLWFSLVREKSTGLSWSSLLSLCFALLVLLGAEGILSS